MWKNAFLLVECKDLPKPHNKILLPKKKKEWRILSDERKLNEFALPVVLPARSVNGISSGGREMLPNGNLMLQKRMKTITNVK